jgi:hypothetical protein
VGKRDVGIHVDSEHPPVGRHVVGAEPTRPAERRVADEQAQRTVPQMSADPLRNLRLGQVEAEALDFDPVPGSELVACALERDLLVGEDHARHALRSHLVGHRAPDAAGGSRDQRPAAVPLAKRLGHGQKSKRILRRI